MKCIMLVVLAVLAPMAAAALEVSAPANPRIDARAFLAITTDALWHREGRRVGEADFSKMSSETGTIVLDARSSEKYRELHIDGAVNLSFPDITESNLARLIPDKNTRILIYCNNNFSNAEQAFPTKLASASLNLSTFTALYAYGYRNVFELGPLIDATRTELKLVPKAR